MSKERQSVSSALPHPRPVCFISTPAPAPSHPASRLKSGCTLQALSAWTELSSFREKLHSLLCHLGTLPNQGHALLTSLPEVFGPPWVWLQICGSSGLWFRFSSGAFFPLVNPMPRSRYIPAALCAWWVHVLLALKLNVFWLYGASPTRHPILEIYSFLMERTTGPILQVVVI